jgi:hypothetical protein
MLAPRERARRSRPREGALSARVKPTTGPPKLAHGTRDMPASLHKALAVTAALDFSEERRSG